MTPRSHAAEKPIPRFLLLLGALIPITAAVAGGARVVKTTADETYVRRDSFSLMRRTDSLTALSDRREVFRLLSGLDSSDRCRRGQPGFCR